MGTLQERYTIGVVGLGYVGLPLAVEFAVSGFTVIGFDISERRVATLKAGTDPTGEVEPGKFARAKVRYTDEAKDLAETNFIIVAVPTPITDHNRPDLSALRGASAIVGIHLQKGSVVVYESTVYPGVTEEVCLPIIEKESGMRLGKDFGIGYSPERINPGDREHTVDRIVKVVSGSDAATTKAVEEVYSAVIKAGCFVAKDIKTAEAAKVIENTQRDLNIALMNELSIIFEKIGIRTKDVLAAASTKWNFHAYHPGLVGGHCIGVDPYYLTYKAEELGYAPRVILAGRAINDSMGRHVSRQVIEGLNECEKVPKRSRAIVLGLTFKENVSDTRNSKVADIIRELQRYGVEVFADDPMVPDEELARFGVPRLRFEDASDIDCVVLATPHEPFRKLRLDDIKARMNERPLLVDIRSVFPEEEAKRKGFVYRCL
ncbi:nucleotide sugar dehydrogenase [Candidatus Woesearchaeota archaeon]|nr:nucleotide sugar dehydrogenase [Candidatus Woesearchaeota archaeon]